MPNKQELFEPVPHITRTRPYAVHESFFSPHAAPALYLHWHPEMEFLYMAEGCLELVIEDRKLPLRPGEAVFIPPNLLHTARCAGEEGGCFRALVFSADFLAGAMDAGQIARCLAPVLEHNRDYICVLSHGKPWERDILACLDAIFRTAEEEAPEKELAVCGLTLLLWQRLYAGHIAAIQGAHAKNRLERQLEPTLRYIRDHFASDMTLAALAQTAHLSPRQFCRSFKQLTGDTPFGYIRRFRVMQSCMRLAHSDAKIGTIASECGFNSISYFNREFLAIMAMTPSAYRQGQRQGDSFAAPPMPSPAL